MEEWAQTETELMRERGIWGPTVGSDLDKWMLDMTEGKLSPGGAQSNFISVDDKYLMEIKLTFL